MPHRIPESQASFYYLNRLAVLALLGAHEPSLSILQTVLDAIHRRAAPGGNQPDFFLARSLDFPARHRQLRDQVSRLHAGPVHSRSGPTVVGGDGRGVRFARGEEFSGLLHQRYRAAPGREDVFGRHPAFAGFAVSGF